jgi:DNA-binding response OmpR family regulator
MRAVLRRNYKSKDEAEVDKWISQDIEVRILEGIVLKCNQELLLTGMEYRLLLMLMTHPKQICSRSTILNGLWDMSGEFIDDNTLSVHIRRLREKIEDIPAAPKHIITVRGVGYKWNTDVVGR